MHAKRTSRLRLAGVTSLALVAFAANSIFCRLALGSALIDPAAFTAIRIGSGAAMLLILVRGPHGGVRRGDWPSAAVLFAYALGFSFAYVRLPVGTGALILFGLVQLTMILGGILRGERPGPRQWLGLAIAAGGLVWLLSPGLSAPPLLPALLMAVAGIAWGVYSLRGRATTDPLRATAKNFLRAVPMTLVVVAVSAGRLEVTTRGVLLAIVSGAVASGLGYVLWYRALRDLRATTAATVQLPVPVLTALGGILFLDESMSLRFVVTTVLILGGVALALRGKEKRCEE